MPRSIVHLAHGASGSAASMLPFVRGLESRGISARAVQLPRGTAERAVATYLRTAPPDEHTVIGGHSFGGRVASLAASEHRYQGLVLLSFPLHAPGAPDRWAERTAHFGQVACPVLLLSGDRDPFAKVELLQQAVERLPTAELHVYPGVRHGLSPVLADALDRIAVFVNSLA